MVNTSIAHWKFVVESTRSKLEVDLAHMSVPIIYGSFATAPPTCVLMDQLDLQALSSLLVRGSLCVIDSRIPPAPLQNDETLRDLHIYFRLGESETWLRYSVETPEYDDPDDIPEDEIDYDWRKPFSVSDKELSALAMKVALGEGFGSLRSRVEQTDYACVFFEETPEEGKLQRHDLHEIATRAELFFRTGIAPTIAKTLEAQGKTVSEIARIMGISRTRVGSALVTNVPANISKLLKKWAPQDLGAK